MAIDVVGNYPKKTWNVFPPGKLQLPNISHGYVDWIQT